VLLGGSPLRFLRLSDAGSAVVDRLTSAAGRAARAEPTAAEAALVDRLVGGGFLLPEPEGGEAPHGSADVTVVVPVRDRPEQLDRALGALTTDGRPGRIVVVDDGSTDAAAVAAVARRHGAEVHRQDVALGPAGARDAGLAAVATPVVAFVDSDVEVAPGWLDVLLGHLVDDRVALVAPRVRTPAGRSARARYDRARSPLDLGDRPGPVAARSRVAYVPAAALVCRTGALRSLDPPGFDPELAVGEDVDLCWRLSDAGHRCWYAAGPEVTHDDRVERRRWGAWWRRRRDYGTSAAPLDARHPGAVAPLGVSGWSVAVWALVAAGHPVAGLAVAGGTAAALVRRLDFLDDPRVAVGLALRGHLGAGELVARALVRPWFPLTAAAAVASRRARRIALAAAVVPPALEWVRRRPDLDPVRWIGLSLADDVAYSTGVWVGCLRARSWGALRPDVASWPPRRG
jgi:mycofactocin system glycosyltransferase